MNITSAQIVQLCSVPNGLVEQDSETPDKHRRTVVALALVEVTIEEGTESHTGRHIWPVICGFGDQTDSLRLWTPNEYPEIAYQIGAFGDAILEPSLGGFGETVGGPALGSADEPEPSQLVSLEQDGVRLAR